MEEAFVYCNLFLSEFSRLGQTGRDGFQNGKAEIPPRAAVIHDRTLRYIRVLLTLAKGKTGRRMPAHPPASRPGGQPSHRPHFQMRNKILLDNRSMTKLASLS